MRVGHPVVGYVLTAQYHAARLAFAREHHHSRTLYSSSILSTYFPFIY